ncbi:hypothetical protein [Neobacillus cucumis]|uniref:Uncharacterized protein n=1 Tax=Neobacillus cucumis TaxID=1740721 RepID=A0A2N5HVU8_9BACI|nr:hypothetical protein [Neobacillus cucumis]PLS09626.1 hypothetical protein CVD27_01970 [Neobacillus cucumis]
MPTVSIVSIFTRGARSSETPELRTARVQADIRRANEVWSTGFAPGVSCGINFVLLREFYRPEITIDAGTVTAGVGDQRIIDLINETRAQVNNATAIYLVYLSGQTFSGGAVGNAGPRFENFFNINNFTIFGRAALSDGAFETYLLAHEVGHVLFGRFLSEDINSFTVNDPSNPGDPHNNNPQNIMFPFVPAMNPFLNSQQCATASQSRVLLENAASTAGLTAMGFAGAAAGGGFAASGSSFGPMVNDESFDQMESSDPCGCSGEHHHNHPHHHHHHHDMHNNPKIVRKLNKRVDCLVKNIGPDKPEIFPKPPKKHKKDCY